MAEPKDGASAPLFPDMSGRSEEDRDILRRARAKIAQLRGAELVSKALQDRVASEMGLDPADDGGGEEGGGPRP
jgi:hypothetical protein